MRVKTINNWYGKERGDSSPSTTWRCRTSISSKPLTFLFITILYIYKFHVSITDLHAQVYTFIVKNCMIGIGIHQIDHTHYDKNQVQKDFDRIYLK